MIIIIIRVIIGGSCSNNCHGLLLLDHFVRIQKDVGSHNTSGYSTNQLLGLNLCRYGMCTVRFGLCVHSCEQVSEMDGEERNLSSLSLSLSLSLFFLPLSFSPSLSRANEEEKEFEILSRSRTRSACCSLAYIYLLSTVHRPMKFQNRGVKRAEKTTATTIENEREREMRDGEKRRERERERQTPKMDNDDVSHWKNEQWRSRLAELNERMMDGWTPLQGQGNKREHLWEWARCQQGKLHFHLSCPFSIWIWKRKRRRRRKKLHTDPLL